jgi:hypothetical protein
MATLSPAFQATLPALHTSAINIPCHCKHILQLAHLPLSTTVLLKHAIVLVQHYILGHNIIFEDLSTVVNVIVIKVWMFGIN